MHEKASNRWLFLIDNMLKCFAIQFCLVVIARRCDEAIHTINLDCFTSFAITLNVKISKNNLCLGWTDNFSKAFLRGFLNAFHGLQL